jgi:3-hydroxyisobutyrate dehydrogenase-like beta-hydroxyacid dehydrogenase
MPREISVSGLKIAVLGLGEAGSLIAADLVRAGASVRGYDPILERTAPGIERVSSPLEAAEGADVVLSLNWSRVSLEAAESVLTALHPGMIYADLNTSAPSKKLQVARTISPSGATFADVALMNPVPGNGLRTPALTSGPGSLEFARIFSELGMPVESVGLEVGTAAARKLARSIFFKGLAACVGEALEAAQQLGCEDWLFENIGQTLEGMGAKTVERLLEGSRTHAVRRREEMDAATEMLLEHGLTPTMAQATSKWLRTLAVSGEIQPPTLPFAPGRVKP